MKLFLRYFFLVTMLVSYVASAQVATGTPLFGSFGGGPFDTINLGNLNVHFAIPVLHKAGRGVPFTYDLTYDSSVWTPVTTSGVTQWKPATNFGWTANTQSNIGYIIANYSSVSNAGVCNLPGGAQSYYSAMYESNPIYVDQFGVSHPFAGILAEYFNPNGCTSVPSSVLQLTVTTYDGSGLTLTINFGLQTATVTTRSAELRTVPVGSGPGQFQDSNGNEVTSNTSGQFFDTLSSTTPVLTVSGTAPNPTTFTYTPPSGTNVAYTMNYKAYTVATNFAVSGVSEYGAMVGYLVDTIQLPDGSQYSFTYEPTPSTPSSGACTPKSGTSACVTARLASVTLATGGSITYAYSGGGTGVNGIESDGSVPSLTRTLNPGGSWAYARSNVSGKHWQTTIASPPDPNNSGSASNVTLIDFQQDGTALSYNFYETKRLIYQGASTLLAETMRCYGGTEAYVTDCSTVPAVSSPILQTATYSSSSAFPNTTTRLSEVTYDTGLVYDDKEYTYGVTPGSAPGTTDLIRETVIAYAFYNRPSSVLIYDWSTGTQTQLASTTYAYDEHAVTTTTGTPQLVSPTGSRGNLTTLTTSTSNTTTISKTFTYYDTGNPKLVTDVNGAQTTLVYGSGSCGNSFPTAVNLPLNLSDSMTWNCTGGVATQVTDANVKSVTSNYTNDPAFWRPESTSDQENITTTFRYQPGPTGSTPMTESKLLFNNNSSVVDVRTYGDGLGRAHDKQVLQSPGASMLDTVSYVYDVLGRLYSTSTPCSTSFNGTCPTNATALAYDALGRVTSTKDANGGQVSYTYTGNDVLQKVSGSQTFQKQFEYDGLGRLTSVCEISSALPGVGTCPQSTSKTGYWTRYQYDALGRVLGVCQNTTQPLSVDCVKTPSSGQQTRTFTYDWMGRMLTESNPETGNNGANGTVTYTYDTIASCGGGPITSNGDVVQKKDNAGNITCYTYDSLHRVLTAGNSTITGATLRAFAYDSTTATPPTGWSATNSNPKGQLIEAKTTNTSGTLITDEWFSYSPRGELTDVYEATPHSGGYYHTTAAYWPTGALETLSGIPGVPTLNYGASGAGLDGEGRFTKVTAASGTNPVTGVTYSTSSTSNPLGALTGITFGSTVSGNDSDSFTYDPNTGRAKTYVFSVNGKTDTGTLTWNTNGTLQKLVINDQITGTTDSQTCTYAHDDLQRVSSAGCGTAWAQTFAYDAFGNITKSGSGSFAPSYTFSAGNTTNQFLSIPTVTVSYDKNGNLLTDNLNTYTWDSNWGSMLTVNTGAVVVTATYDAFGVVVEQQSGSAYTEILYSPVGKTALMNGPALAKAFVPLPGGETAVYTSTGLAYYRHADWLGSSRLASTPARAMYSATAHSPFGETYKTAGTADASFTGQNSDTVPSLYDFTFRRHSPSQGRWISPDPAGLGAVSVASPQSWNRYAYVGNNPLALVDPLGLNGGCDETDVSYDCLFGGPGGGGGGGGAGALLNLVNGGGGGGGECTLDGVATPCSMVSSALSSGTAFDCGGLCGAAWIPGAGFAFPLFTADDISWLFSFPTIYAGIPLTNAALAETLGLPSLSNLADYSASNGDLGVAANNFGQGPPKPSKPQSGATKVRTIDCALVKQIFTVCTYACTEGTGATGAGIWPLSTIRKYPACSGVTSCPNFIFVEAVGHKASIAGCSKIN